MKFKLGDRVICVDISGLVDDDTLKLGGVYSYIDNSAVDLIILEGVKYHYFADRFILATPLTEALA